MGGWFRRGSAAGSGASRALRAREPHLEAKLGPFWDAKLSNAAFHAMCHRFCASCHQFQTVAFAVLDGELYFHRCQASSGVQLDDLTEVATMVALLLKLVGGKASKLQEHFGILPPPRKPTPPAKPSLEDAIAQVREHCVTVTTEVPPSSDDVRAVGELLA